MSTEARPEPRVPSGDPSPRDARRERWLRLSDPDDGLPVAPPTFENMLAGALFLATALAFGVLGLPRIHGAIGLFLFAGAGVYLVALAWGAFRVRPREGGDGVFHGFMLPVLLQSLFYAAAGYHAVAAGFTRHDHTPEMFVLGAALLALLGTGGSFVLTHVARRGEPLVVAQLLGPFLLTFGLGLVFVG